ncbi:unnamed protein product, partial [Ectocarpus sp. 4 AP-2014]
MSLSRVLGTYQDTCDRTPERIDSRICRSLPPPSKEEFFVRTSGIDTVGDGTSAGRDPTW